MSMEMTSIPLRLPKTSTWQYFPFSKFTDDVHGYVCNAITKGKSHRSERFFHIRAHLVGYVCMYVCMPTYFCKTMGNATTGNLNSRRDQVRTQPRKGSESVSSTSYAVGGIPHVQILSSRPTRPSAARPVCRSQSMSTIHTYARFGKDRYQSISTTSVHPAPPFSKHS